MKPREKKLVLGIAAIVGLLAVYYVYDSIAEQFTQRDAQLAAKQKALADAQLRIDDGKRAKELIKAAEKRSLPSDSEQATSSYNDWLLKLVDNAKLTAPTLQPKKPIPANKDTFFAKHSFTVKGRCDKDMKQLVQFLYDFYAANHLHRIDRLTINPTNDSSQLEVMIEIEALQLPTADRTETLADNKLPKLAKGDLAAYQKVIGERNLFSPAPPPRVASTGGPPPAPPPLDVAKFTSLTGIVAQNDEPLLYITVKPTGEEFKGLKVGDEFTVGGVSYKVISIGVRDAVLAAEGKNVQVSLGGNLRDATPVSAGEL